MEQKEQEEETNRLVCHDCGCIIDPEKDSHFTTGEGYVVCSDCYESDYFTCSRCGDVHNIEHSYDVEGGDVLCGNCADAHTVVCRDCGCRVYDDDAYSYGCGEYLCRDCYERGYFTCERCDEVCDEELMRRVGGRFLCESCGKEYLTVNKGKHFCNACFWRRVGAGLYDNTRLSKELAQCQ